MKIYNSVKEVINELALNVEVIYKPYGTWRIKSHIGTPSYRRSLFDTEPDHYISVSYLSHNEEDWIGILDGSKYNPQNFNDWLTDVAQYDPDIGNLEQYRDDELEELFNEYCKAVWADSSNDANYEPVDERHERLALALFDELVEDQVNYESELELIICDNDKVIVLDEDESEFYREDLNEAWTALNTGLEENIKLFKEKFQEWKEG